MAVNKNFVVKNGLEVGNNLIVADADNNLIGIGTSTPAYNLHVSGGIAATTFYFIGNISAGGTTGAVGSLLRIGNNGVEWTPTPGTRTSQTFTATAGQTVFNFTHTVGLVDVFINGVKLSSSEYLDGATTITLLTPAFSGDVVEVIGYSIYGVGAGVSGISGLTILDEGVVTGTPTAVTSINFTGGDVTAAGTGAGVTVDIKPSRWAFNSVGIYTSKNVGIGTTNPTSDLTVRGNTSLVGVLTVKSAYNDGVQIFPSDRRIYSGIITSNSLYVSSNQYSTLSLPSKIADTVPTGSQSIFINPSEITQIQALDKLTIAGIFNQIDIVGVGTTTVSSYNQTFLTTTLSTSVSAGSTVIGLASSTGISIGSSLSISGIFNNIPVQYITTVLTDDGIKPAVQIRPADVYGLVINVGTTVGFSSVLTYRSAAFIGAGNTHNGPIPSGTDATIERIVTPTSAGIFSGSSTGDLVRITQLGTGNAIVVEDSANPDATPFIVDALGNVGIGTTSLPAALTVVGSGTSTSQLYVTGVSTVLSSNLRIRNPANTFEYTIAGSAIVAARTLTLPLISANDTIAVLGLSQTFSAAQTFSSTLTHSATTTGFAATSYTTGTVAIGGTLQTGSITIGQATVSQTLNLANGVSVAGTSKTINLGTGGASGSFTQINIGPTAGVGTVSVGAGTSVGIGTVNPLSPLHVIGDARVGINTAQGVILTSQNGTKYRLIVADNGTLSTVLVP